MEAEEPETKKSKTKTNNNVFTNNKPKDSFSHAKRKHGMQDITEMSGKILTYAEVLVYAYITVKFQLRSSINMPLTESSI